MNHISDNVIDDVGQKHVDINDHVDTKDVGKTITDVEWNNF